MTQTKEALNISKEQILMAQIETANTLRPHTPIRDIVEETNILYNHLRRLAANAAEKQFTGSVFTVRASAIDETDLPQPAQKQTQKPETPATPPKETKKATLSPRQRETLDAAVRLAHAGKPITARNISRCKNIYIEPKNVLSQLKALAGKHYVELNESKRPATARVLKNPDGSKFEPLEKTESGGQTVTKCPTRYAGGYTPAAHL